MGLDLGFPSFSINHQSPIDHPIFHGIFSKKAETLQKAFGYQWDIIQKIYEKPMSNVSDVLQDQDCA